jgi:hypothetical protein
MDSLITNKSPNIPMQQIHIEPLPVCCPVSLNPIEGSQIKISYTPVAGHLEVYGLRQHVNSYKGGLKCPRSGAYVVRDMEHMISSIAQHCADIVLVPVCVEADLKLNVADTEPSQMIISCVAHPRQVGEP